MMIDDSWNAQHVSAIPLFDLKAQMHSGARERVSERVGQQMSAVERESGTSSAEQANESAVRANGGAHGPVLYA